MGEMNNIFTKRSEANKINSDLETRRINRSGSKASSVDRILYLQRTIGNQAVSRLIRSKALQAKLRIGQPGDVYEQEADRVADEVMRMPEMQRQVEEEEEEEILQTKENPGPTPGVIHDLEARIQSLKGGGHSLPEENREFMERRFGIDFSGVRLHADSDAAQMSRELNAEAFTYGRGIYFGAGRYSPGTLSGKRLLAHELTHVVQQTSNTTIVLRSYVQLSPTPAGEEERTEQGPLQALSCPCGESTRVNYDSLTFEFIMSLAPTIQPIARSEGIPIDPVAGAIADEYDRRRGYRTIVDGAQDAIIDALPECFIDVDRFFDIQNRLLNTLENDVGPANINVRTALELVRRGELQVQGSPPTNIQVNQIIDFLLTEHGTVQATAAVISRAQRLFGPYLVGYPDYLSESILVEYFKQGDSYYDRFRRTLEATPGHQPCPGDGGCRFVYNRDRILDTLSRGFIRQAIMEPTLTIV